MHIMDENTSTATYGLENGTTIYSNLPKGILLEWLFRLRQADHEFPFLEPEKNLVVVDLNQRYLDHILSEVFPDFLSEAKQRKVEIPSFPHHTTPSHLDLYHSDTHPQLRRVYGRVKGRDSLTEKLTRSNGKYHAMGSDDFHLNVNDVMGIKVEVRDGTSLDREVKRIRSHPKLELIDTNVHGTPTYNSLHDIFRWRANTIPPKMLFEVQYETEEQCRANYKGLNGAKSHDQYGQEKLDQPHLQGENQIIILQKNGREHRKIIPVKLSNPFVQYTLINY